MLLSTVIAPVLSLIVIRSDDGTLETVYCIGCVPVTIGGAEVIDELPWLMVKESEA